MNNTHPVSFEFVSATRQSKDEFWQKSALGASLQRLTKVGGFRASIAYDNRRGLPEIYNERLQADDAAETMIFVHDDVWFDDYFLMQRVAEGLKAFDVLGVAGNRRRQPKQIAWVTNGTEPKWDERQYLSGMVAHGQTPFGAVTPFGPPGASCELLDGVLLALQPKVLKQHAVRFDTRFDFHFYDLDFCRCARVAGLQLGTWPIAITHQSMGGFGSESWNRGYQTYLEKWGD